MSETKKAKATEATEATETKKAYDPEELVDYTAPLLPGKSQQEIVGAVNGVNFRVKRGVSVKIKRKYLEVLENAARQQYAAYVTSNAIAKQGEAPAVKM